MKPQDLMKTTILAQAKRDDSNFVEFTHRGATKKSIVEYGDFRQVTKKDNQTEIKDSISLLDFESTIVMRGDKITLDNIDYSIEYFTLVIPGIYKAFAVKTQKTGAVKWS